MNYAIYGLKNKHFDLLDKPEEKSWSATNSVLRHPAKGFSILSRWQAELEEREQYVTKQEALHQQAELAQLQVAVRQELDGLRQDRRTVAELRPSRFTSNESMVDGGAHNAAQVLAEVLLSLTSQSGRGSLSRGSIEGSSSYDGKQHSAHRGRSLRRKRALPSLDKEEWDGAVQPAPQPRRPKYRPRAPRPGSPDRWAPPTFAPSSSGITCPTEPGLPSPWPSDVAEHPLVVAAHVPHPPPPPPQSPPPLTPAQHPSPATMPPPPPQQTGTAPDPALGWQAEFQRLAAEVQQAVHAIRAALQDGQRPALSAAQEEMAHRQQLQQQALQHQQEQQRSLEERLQQQAEVQRLQHQCLQQLLSGGRHGASLPPTPAPAAPPHSPAPTGPAPGVAMPCTPPPAPPSLWHNAPQPSPQPVCCTPEAAGPWAYPGPGPAPIPGGYGTAAVPTPHRVAPGPPRPPASHPYPFQALYASLYGPEVLEFGPPPAATALPLPRAVAPAEHWQYEQQLQETERLRYEAVAALQETRRLAEEARRRRQAEGDERWRAQEALRAVHAREQQLALREQAVQLQEERQAAQYQQPASELPPYWLGLSVDNSAPADRTTSPRNEPALSALYPTGPFSPVAPPCFHPEPPRPPRPEAFPSPPFSPPPPLPHPPPPLPVSSPTAALLSPVASGAMQVATPQPVAPPAEPVGLASLAAPPPGSPLTPAAAALAGAAPARTPPWAEGLTCRWDREQEEREQRVRAARRKLEELMKQSERRETTSELAAASPPPPPPKEGDGAGGAGVAGRLAQSRRELEGQQRALQELEARLLGRDPLPLPPAPVVPPAPPPLGQQPPYNDGPLRPPLLSNERREAIQPNPPSKTVAAEGELLEQETEGDTSRWGGAGPEHRPSVTLERMPLRRTPPPAAGSVDLGPLVGPGANAAEREPAPQPPPEPEREAERRREEQREREREERQRSAREEERRREEREREEERRIEAERAREQEREREREREEREERERLAERREREERERREKEERERRLKEEAEKRAREERERQAREERARREKEEQERERERREAEERVRRERDEEERRAREAKQAAAKAEREERERREREEKERREREAKAAEQPPGAADAKRASLTAEEAGPSQAATARRSLPGEDSDDEALRQLQQLKGLRSARDLKQAALNAGTTVVSGQPRVPSPPPAGAAPVAAPATRPPTEGERFLAAVPPAHCLWCLDVLAKHLEGAMAKLGEVESDDDDDENPFNFIVQGRDPPVRWPTKKKVLDCILSNSKLTSHPSEAQAKAHTLLEVVRSFPPVPPELSPGLLPPALLPALADAPAGLDDDTLKRHTPREAYEAWRLLAGLLRAVRKPLGRHTATLAARLAAAIGHHAAAGEEAVAAVGATLQRLSAAEPGFTPQAMARPQSTTKVQARGLAGFGAFRGAGADLLTDGPPKGDTLQPNAAAADAPDPPPAAPSAPAKKPAPKAATSPAVGGLGGGFQWTPPPRAGGRAGGRGTGRGRGTMAKFITGKGGSSDESDRDAPAAPKPPAPASRKPPPLANLDNDSDFDF